MNSSFLDKIRAFGMTGLQIGDDLAKVEKAHSIELVPTEKNKVTREIEGYEQFSASMRFDASEMAQYYEVFFV